LNGCATRWKTSYPRRRENPQETPRRLQCLNRFAGYCVCRGKITWRHVRRRHVMAEISTKQTPWLSAISRLCVS
jgi:hypothetical protein